MLRDELPDETPLFADACEMGYRLHADWTATGPRRFFYPSNYIALGWGFPAAVGAAAALGDVPVASVSGDGGFVMTAQELATAARYGLRAIAVVHNDSAYGAIKNIQRRDHDGRYLDVDLNNPDFPRLAAAFGVASARAGDPDAFREALRRALAAGPDRDRSARPLATTAGPPVGAWSTPGLRGVPRAPCMEGRTSSAGPGAQNELSSIISPSARLPSACHTLALIEFLTNRTEPSPNATFTPPGCEPEKPPT